MPPSPPAAAAAAAGGAEGGASSHRHGYRGTHGRLSGDGAGEALQILSPWGLGCPPPKKKAPSPGLLPWGVRARRVRGGKYCPPLDGGSPGVGAPQGTPSLDASQAPPVRVLLQGGRESCVPAGWGQGHLLKVLLTPCVSPLHLCSPPGVLLAPQTPGHGKTSGHHSAHVRVHHGAPWRPFPMSPAPRGHATASRVPNAAPGPAGTCGVVLWRR